MTAQEIVEALCLQAERVGFYSRQDHDVADLARLRRDRIKAALVEYLEGTSKSKYGRWAKLEEACRGK